MFQQNISLKSRPTGRRSNYSGRTQIYEYTLPVNALVTAQTNLIEYQTFLLPLLNQ